ncbi:MAG: hypothetical protein AB7F76_18420, partial [Parvibaculaceae bacterium]
MGFTLLMALCGGGLTLLFGSFLPGLLSIFLAAGCGIYLLLTTVRCPYCGSGEIPPLIFAESGTFWSKPIEEPLVIETRCGVCKNDLSLPFD